MRSKLKYVEGLQNRRERLKHLALEHLSPVDAENLGLYDGNVLDSVAGRVIERLHKHHVPVPVPLLSIVSRGLSYTNESIYFDLRSATDAELFFRLGFRDPNTTGTYEPTPLAYAAKSGCSIAYILWLIEHGADVSRCLEYSSDTFPQFVIQGATNAHWLSGWIGDWIPSSQNVECLNPEERRAVGQLNAIVLRVYARDGCRCRCSIGGYSPLLWMLGRMYYDTKAVTSLVARLAWYMEHFGSDMSVQQHKDSVRFITFETLRIQHTCCNPKSSWDWPCPSYDFEEIQEIEEEQAALLEILGDLVAEFEGRVMDILEQESTETLAALVEFWTGYWCDRIKEVLEDLNSAMISDEERLAAERIGVRWYDEPDEEPEEEDKRDIKYWYRRIDEIA
ncbi:hypothetical protein DL766_000834 [Monosporascus sp. MC13-8B]|uniref:Uncharacterized protein n=1 Tax=Monosporascus cannonballus TaxID=155416 RepID=A0ABY0H1D9_9PEZI|nr:hypothetical protein DL762_007016 [Monosporascus cannonballus]RYO94130.1 hypothetical protein DL763_004198 [Monosporascus cannonballus]RYP38624.1 hypothetical protein DL766_000834 [Monosporascus sp. MC13-8B]